MILIKHWAACTAFLCASAAWAQGAHPHHQPAPVASQAAKAPSQAQDRAAHQSAFADYKPFSAEVQPKDWRQANEEVLAVGGHVGLLKGETAQQRGHGSHGAKQPVPPRPEGK